MGATLSKISGAFLSLFAGFSAFVLTLLGFLLLGSLDQQIAASIIIGLFALLVVWVASERPNSAQARAVASLIDRLLAVGRGDLSSPPPPALKQQMPALAAAVEGLFEQVRSNLDNAQAMAMYDPVTALPNRVHFKREADRILAARSTEESAALLFIDLDGFKEVNDRLGHAQGDDVLVMVANRLRLVLKAEVTAGMMAPPLLARLAGDEFTMLLPDTGSREEAERIASAAIAALAEPFVADGQSILMGASIGIALCPEHGTDLAGLMKAADFAMYHAKNSGRSRLCVYEPGFARASQAKAEFESSLRQAIERRELHLAFEPQLCLRSGAIIGGQAMIRWQGGKGAKVLAPSEPMLQETGLGIQLAEWTLDSVTAALSRWRTADLKHRLGFPIGARQFERLDFVQRLRGALAQTGPAPWNVELELSEAAAAGCDKWTMAELERLRREGVTVAVIGFGAGGVPLSRLSSVPVDRVRLDESLVANIDRCERARGVVASLVHLIHGLGAEAMAAGVERHEQVEVLRVLGCDVVQGFFGVDPMPEEAFLAWVDAQDCARSLARAS
jgi:diguanylate cyclase (GGDEF)-like protein